MFLKKKLSRNKIHMDLFFINLLVQKMKEKNIYNLIKMKFEALLNI